MSTKQQQLSGIRQTLRQQDPAQVIALLQQLQQQQPPLLDCYQLLLPLLFKAGRLDELQQNAEQAIQQFPLESLGYQALSMSLRFGQHHQRAIEVLLQAKQHCGVSAVLLHQLGVLYKESGQLQLAKEYLTQAIALNPAQADSWWQRADLAGSLCSEQRQQLRQLASTARRLQDKASFYYSLFSACDKAQLYSEAFAALQQGAQAKRQSLHYEPERELAEFEAIAKTFSPTLLSKPALQPDLGKEVIFILGMPRSGTTLVEQILSSHTAVTAGDELFELGRACTDLLKAKDLRLAFPDWAEALSAQDWHQIGSNYLKRTAYLQHKGRFTDKMPLNFKAIGLIHRALPGAKIVHCRRNAMDTIWSCYRQLFAEGIAFSYNLQELTDYYLAYRSLMKHWQQHLSQQILTLDYESLVQDQLQQSQQLLQFLDLPWQPSCLDFHQNTRAVHTVSNSQVRQPIFSSGIGSWKPYQSQLAEIATQLASAGLL